jgi:hypothetical protein
MSNVIVYSNSLGSADWIRVVSVTDEVISEVLFEGHRVTVDDLVELMYDASARRPRKVTAVDLTDEQMEELCRE